MIQEIENEQPMSFRPAAEKPEVPEGWSHDALVLIGGALAPVVCQWIAYDEEDREEEGLEPNFYTTSLSPNYFLNTEVGDVVPEVRYWLLIQHPDNFEETVMKTTWTF